MKPTYVLRAVLLQTLCLPELFVFASDSQLDGVVSAVPTLDPVEGDWRDDCPPNISVCGKTTNVEVIRRHNETVYVTQNHTKTTIKELPPHTRVITSISVVTVKDVTEQGLCRDTSIIYDAAPLTVTVDVNLTTTREFVPIVNSTTVVTSIVTAPVLKQCFIKPSSLGSVAAPITSSANDPRLAATSDELSTGEASTTLPTAISELFAEAKESGDFDDGSENSETASYNYF